MKKTLLVIALLAVAVSAGAQEKNYTRNGNTFAQKVRTASDLSKSDTPTAYVWRDSKGNEYPIILHTYTKREKAGRITCYVVRTSQKTGNDYKYYLPNGEEIAREILSETPKPR